MMGRRMATAVLVLVLGFVDAAADELRVAMVAVTGRQRTALVETMDRFEKANPGIIVRFDQIEHETYKERFAGYARDGAYDVMFWFAGDQLAAAVADDLIRSMIEIPLHWEWVNTLPPAMLDTARVGSTVFGMPLSANSWGFYYYKPTFQQLGLKPPETWEQFLATAEALQAAGIVPFGLGSRFPWTAAAWFDYLNLRLNGPVFHVAQLQGRQSFDDARTRKVLTLWGDLIRRGWFQPGHADMDWRGTVPGLLRRQTGMILMANALVSQISPQQRSNVGFFRFPIIDPTVPVAEDAPTDLLVVPRAGKSIDAAGKFLNYMARPDVQSAFNLNIGLLPARREAVLPDDELLQAGAATLAAARSLTQQFDRDARPAIREAGLTAFAAFLSDPNRVEETIQALETARLQRSP
jgi:multiple sugar transport system substrate-binding protein